MQIPKSSLIPPHWLLPLAYLAVYIGWGTTYLAIRVGVQSIGPATFLGLRFGIAALALVPLIALQKAWNSQPRERIQHSALQGILLLVGGLLPVAYAEQSIPSNITAIIIGCTPIAFAAFDRLLNGTPIRRPVMIGFVFGFLGLLLLSVGHSAPDAPSTEALNDSVMVSPKGLALVITGFLIWSFGSVYSRRLKPVTHPLVNVLIQYVAAGAVLLFFAFTVEGFRFTQLATCDAPFWISLAYISLAPSLISYTAYLWLIKNEPSSRVSTYAFVNPVVAVIAGALILDEPAPPKVLAALGLVLVGTWFTFRKDKPVR